MQYLRSRFSVMIGVMVVVIAVIGGQLSPVVGVLAQDGDLCGQIVADALSVAGEVCTGLVPGEVCYGAGTVAVTGEATLATGGDTANVSMIDRLATNVDLDANNWGIAVLALTAGLPEDSGQAVKAVLFGDAEMARPVQTASERPTLKVWNGGGADVNLRNGAGISYELVGVLSPGAEAVADGRNEQADWLRIQYEGGVAWVFSPLIDWEGDANTLEVLLPNDVTPAVQASGQPFDAFTLVTDSTPMCGAPSSGLLLQYSGEQPASLQVNQVGLEFSDATLLLRAVPDSALDVMVVTGSVSVTARGIPESVDVSRAVRVNLGGEDGLMPTAPPVVVPSYAFSDVAYAPLGLLSGDLACVVGVPAGSGDVVLRVGPGAERGEIASMRADTGYAVSGWANDPNGAPWWELDTGTQKSWVAQSAVRAVGACDTVAEVEAPPIVVGPPAGGVPPVSGGAPTGPDLALTGNSVWQMRPGQDVMSGQCSGAPAINFCDHLAAIAPASGGISWKGMEASPYLLGQSQPNVYYYSGPNVLGTGNVTMTLTFTSETTLSMTMVLVLNSEPDCQHTYYYTGSRNW